MVLALLLGQKLLCQNGELGMFDCTYSKEIIVPYGYSADTSVKVKPLLEQKVFYSFRDQFTFWYKVVVKEDRLLNFKIKALNDSDAYTVYVYNYNGNGFCDKVYYKKIVPVTATFFIGKGAGEIKNTNDKSFKAKKDNVYYIGVLNTSLNNCGHRFILTCNKDTLKVDALHLPCRTDVASLNKSITHTVKKEPVTPVIVAKKDTFIPVVTKTEIIIPQKSEAVSYYFTITTINAKNKLPVESKISLYEKTAGVQVDVSTISKGEFKFLLEQGKEYIVKTSALGYQAKDVPLVGSILVSEKKVKQEILLEGLKEGQSFVLKSIYFVPNTYALKKESIEEMEKLLGFLKNNETMVIEIQGHTNGDNKIEKTPAYSQLGEEWNFSGSSKKLSQKRAEVIKNYLVTNGIAETRLVAKGYGGQKYLIKDPENNQEAQQNIRVEVSVVKN